MATPCKHCGHLMMYHLDRAVAPCAVDSPPKWDEEGQRLTWAPAVKCRCMGYEPSKPGDVISVDR